LYEFLKLIKFACSIYDLNADRGRYITATEAEAIGADFSFFFLGQREDELPFFPLPSEVGPLGPIYSYGLWGSAVSSPSGVWGKAPVDKRLGAYWSQKVQLKLIAVFVDFPKNKCNLLHKTSLMS